LQGRRARFPTHHAGFAARCVERLVKK
jgi:hypothetical protein